MGKSTTEMGERHARHVNDVLGLVHSQGSGNQFHRQTDGRCEDDVTYAFAQDSKSTLADSMSIKFVDWDKVVQQAGGLLPAMPIRRYAGTNLAVVSHELILVRLDDFAALLDDANTFRSE